MFVVHDRWYNVALLSLFSLVFLLSGCVATQNGASGSAKVESGTLTVKGKVQQISIAEGTMVVTPPKGDRVTLKFTPQTAVKGGTLKEITKSQPVQVIYTVKDGQNSASSIEILPQGSCG